MVLLDVLTACERPARSRHPEPRNRQRRRDVADDHGILGVLDWKALTTFTQPRPVRRRRQRRPLRRM